MHWRLVASAESKGRCHCCDRRSSGTWCFSVQQRYLMLIIRGSGVQPVMISLSSYDDFVAREGELLFKSDPIAITKEMIHAFCTSIDQMDWFHFDEEQATEAFGGIIAPGTMTITLIHPAYFREVQLEGLRALFLGLDRFRVIGPLKAGAEIVLEFGVQKAEVRSEGFAVYYDFTWRDNASDDEISVGTTIIRYWPM